MVTFLRFMRALLLVVAVMQLPELYKIIKLMDMPENFTFLVLRSIPFLTFIVVFINSIDFINRKAGKKVVKNYWNL